MKTGNEKIIYFEKDEHMKEHQDELQAQLKGASVDEIIDPQIWGYLSIKQAGQLRRWVNQFIKANTEQSEKLAIPYMNKKLRWKLREIKTKLQIQEIKKRAQVIKETQKNRMRAKNEK